MVLEKLRVMRGGGARAGSTLRGKLRAARPVTSHKLSVILTLMKESNHENFIIQNLIKSNIIFNKRLANTPCS